MIIRLPDAARDRLAAMLRARAQAERDVALYVEGVLATTGRTLEDFESFDDATGTITLREPDEAPAPEV